jgi:hypothetical protein
VVYANAVAPPARGKSVRGTAEGAGVLAYTLTVAVITMLLYPVGHAPIGFGLLFLGLLARLCTRRPPLWYRTALDLPLAAFAAVLILSAVLSPYPFVSAGVTFSLMASGATLFGSFTWLLHRATGARALLLHAWALGTPVAAALGLASLRYDNRATTPGGLGPNGLGLTLLIGTLLCLALAFGARARQRVFWFGCSAVAAAGLFATQSRAAWLGWALGALYLTLQVFRNRPKQLAGILAAVLMAVVLLGGAGMRHRLAATVPEAIPRPAEQAMAPPDDEARIMGWQIPLMPRRAPRRAIAPPDDEARILGWQIPEAPPPLWIRVRDSLGGDFRDRIVIWQTSLRMIRSRPWIGTGFGTYFDAYNRWKGPTAQSKPFAHDLPLNLAVETGLLGLAAVFWIAASGIAIWARQPRPAGGVDPLRAVIPAMWIGLVIDQLADNSMNAVNTSVAFWFLLALSVSPRLTPAQSEPALPPEAAPPPGDAHPAFAPHDESTIRVRPAD